MMVTGASSCHLSCVHAVSDHAAVRPASFRAARSPLRQQVCCGGSFHCRLADFGEGIASVAGRRALERNKRSSGVAMLLEEACPAILAVRL